MIALNNVACADAYSTAATIEEYFPGGRLAYLVANNSAYMQVQRATQPGQGGAEWSPEFLVNPTAGSFARVVGVRFRNAVAGSVARVIVQIWLPSDAQPEGGTPFDSTLTSSGSVTPAGGVVTGIIPAAGTTPTAGTGFTYTHTNGTGVYVFTFTTAFAATPLVLLTSAEPTNSSAVIAAQSTTGFTVNTRNPGTNTATDFAFNFTAQAVT